MARIGMSGGLDDWIRRRGITHPLIVPMLRNQILIMLILLLVATGIASDTLWGIWMACGFAVMSLILYSWARFFSMTVLDSYGSVFIRAVILRFLLRLILIAFALYAALVYGQADPIALLAGVAAGTLAPLLTVVMEKGKKN